MRIDPLVDESVGLAGTYRYNLKATGARSTKVYVDRGRATRFCWRGVSHIAWTENI
jgi:hypothetical protein